jgi:O-antigen/teichoic acid export membrane protein
MMDRESIAKNIKWLAAANILTKPLWFGFLLLSARLLGPGEFGRSMFAISYVALIAVLFEGGIDILAVRDLAVAPELYRRFAAHTMMAKAISAVVVAFLAIGSSFVIGMSKGEIALIAMATVYSAALVFMTHVRFLFRGFEIMRFEAYSVIAEKGFVLLLCGGALFFVRTAEQFLLWYMISYMMACAITVWFGVRVIGPPHWGLDFRYLWTGILKPALPYAIMSLMMVAYFRSATIMLKALTGSEEIVGYYNAAYRIVESFLLFPVMLIGPLYPSFSRLRHEKSYVNGLLFHGSRIMLLISTGISVPILLFRREFTLLFFGGAYREATLAVGLLALAMIPLGITAVHGGLVAAVGRQGRANLPLLLITLGNFALHLLLIPPFGLLGAVIVTLFTECAVALTNLWVVRDFVVAGEYAKVYLRALGPVAIGILASGLIPASSGFPLHLSIVLASMGMAFVVFRFVTKSDVQRLFARA